MSKDLEEVRELVMGVSGRRASLAQRSARAEARGRKDCVWRIARRPRVQGKIKNLYKIKSEK